MDRRELIERLENLNGPDRDVNFDIWAALDDADEGAENYGPHLRALMSSRIPNYTASLDAAIALVEKVRPGWKKQVFEGRSGTWIARISSPRYDTSSTDYMRERDPDGSPNGAIALLIVLLKSLSPTEGE